VVSWTRDRLGMAQPYHPWDAEMISCPFEVIAGRCRLRLNISGLGEHAHLRVSLFDEGFHPVPRFSGPDAALVTDNGLRVPVRWGGGEVMQPSHGLLRLALHFGGVRPEDARLYAAYLGE